jgi:uncharacterized paraquat-inducible protein A
MKKKTCDHKQSDWMESYPPGYGYCRECIKIQYENAPRCPHCGIKQGFAMGTGDCGCEVDPE